MRVRAAQDEVKRHKRLRFGRVGRDVCQEFNKDATSVKIVRRTSSVMERFSRMAFVACLLELISLS